MIRFVRLFHGLQKVREFERYQHIRNRYRCILDLNQNATILLEISVFYRTSSIKSMKYRLTGVINMMHIMYIMHIKGKACAVKIDCSTKLSPQKKQIFLVELSQCATTIVRLHVKILRPACFLNSVGSRRM